MKIHEPSPKNSYFKLTNIIKLITQTHKIVIITLNLDLSLIKQTLFTDQPIFTKEKLGTITLNNNSLFKEILKLLSTLIKTNKITKINNSSILNH